MGSLGTLMKEAAVIFVSKVFGSFLAATTPQGVRARALYF